MDQSVINDSNALIERAQTLLPDIQRFSPQTEHERHIPDALIGKIRDAGLFRLYQPKHFGGYELPYGSTQLRISTLIGSVCPSMAWVHSVLSFHSWILGILPLSAQEAVWGDNPDTLVSSAVAFSRASVEIVDGGYRISGHWKFSSGVQAAGWVMVRALLEREGAEPQQLFFLVPKEKLKVIDVWHPIGLRGTGSNDVEIDSAFVPAELAVDMLTMRGNGIRHSGNPAPLYSLPYMALASYCVAAPGIGAARGALEHFRQETCKSAVHKAQLTRQIRFAEASANVDCAEMLMQATAQHLEEAVAISTPVPLLAQVAGKRNTAFAMRLCRTAVGALVEMLGAHGIAENHPIHKAQRELFAIGSHMGLNWDASGEMYGRTAFDTPGGSAGVGVSGRPTYRPRY